MHEHFIHPHVHDVVFADNATLTSLSLKISKHIADKDIHITKEEREAWNSKVTQSELEEVKKLIPVIDPSVDPSEIVIPTKTSQLINDSDFQSEQNVKDLLSSYGITCAQDYSNFVNKSTLATINGQRLYNGGDIKITNFKDTEPLFTINNQPVYHNSQVIVSDEHGVDTRIEVDPTASAKIKFIQDRIELWREGEEHPRLYIHMPTERPYFGTDAAIFMWIDELQQYVKLQLNLVIPEND